MKKILLFLLGLYTGLIIFMPKDNLYYTLQDFLKDKKIYINSDINSNIILNLKNGTVYYSGMDISRFKKISVMPFILFNEIKVENLSLTAGNYKIKNIKAFYSVFYPVKIFVKGEGSFGKLDGYVDLIKKEVKIYILNLTDAYLKNFLKKDKKGYYYYAKF